MLLPSIQISNHAEDDRPLGRYGRMALAYLRANHPDRYMALKMDGALMEMMHRVQRDAAEQIERLIQRMLLDDPMLVTNAILERTRHWNSSRAWLKIVLQTAVLTAR